MNPSATRWVPGTRLAWLCALALPAYVVGGHGVLFGVLYNVVIIALAVLESRGLRGHLPSVERVTESRLVLGLKNEVTLKFHNGTGRSIRLTARDDFPQGFRAEPDELNVHLPPHARRQRSYSVLPPRRGRFEFGDLHLRVEGPARLGALLVTLPATAEAKVYPNLRGPKRYELAARLGALLNVGVRNIRRTGGGGEFEQLREYVPGDPFRDLDWKATAKRQRPITRISGQERSQTVIVGLDAGRMMSTQLDDITKLDHAINAALLLTFVALRGGDKVGLIVFAEGVHHFVPPARGTAQYRRILEALFGIEASVTYVDFRRLVEFVQLRIPRRALLVLFSDLLDESQAMPLAEQATILRKKHLPVCVTMNDPVAEAFSEVPVATSEDAYRRAAAADLLAERDQVKRHLTKAGVGLVEAPAGELAVATVNRYLEIKSRRAL